MSNARSPLDSLFSAIDYETDSTYVSEAMGACLEWMETDDGAEYIKGLGYADALAEEVTTRPAPDDDAVERSAERMYNYLATEVDDDIANTFPLTLAYTWEGLQEHNERDTDVWRALARAAAGPGPDLDAVLDDAFGDGSSLDVLVTRLFEGDDFTATLMDCGQPGRSLRGTGPTRMAAIADAVAKAKGVQGAS